MRRSKSDCSKYAKNYRSISQRRMTHHDDEFDEEKEMERLRSILRNTEAHLLQQQVQSEGGMVAKKRGRQEDVEDTPKATKGEPKMLSTSLTGELKDNDDDANPVYMANTDNIPLILPSKKSKKEKNDTRFVQLSPEEIRNAKLLQKNTSRKLMQLSTRVEQKKRRDEMYGKLKASAISVEEQQLLASSATLGKRMSKRETLQRLLRKERAGLVLTEEEKDLLYTKRDLPDDIDDHNTEDLSKDQLTSVSNDATMDSMKQLRKTKAMKKESKLEVEKVENSSPTRPTANQDTDTERNDSFKAACKGNEAGDGDEEVATHGDSNLSNKKSSPTQDDVISELKDTTKSTIAAQMMASLTLLRAQTGPNIVQQGNENDKNSSSEKTEKISEEASEKKAKPYIPSNPIVLKTAAALGLQSSDLGSGRKIVEVKRPQDVLESRYDLPVCGMEFEIMDAIRNNDVTIICGETGSGKSTQVPQFLYEAGFAKSLSEGEGKTFLIGVTQPRRVAALSTAKRVCYEMGAGNGYRIGNGPKNNGNIVAYQTRYESAGLGNDTRLKFMTDGILLQEIQSDFLLRQYSVIILDEAHERNLNTDVLLGLLSAALPLRQKAATEEGSGLVPLKLVIMSATIRVEDFTSNDKLFPNIQPMVVTVPGRTFPVTIHHSKVTELEKYGTLVESNKTSSNKFDTDNFTCTTLTLLEDEAFNKVCKIHRKLPQGGILVFLTGKQEIVRMVRRLKKCLNRSSYKSSISKDVDQIQNVPIDNHNDISPRDLDDEEVDGDVFQAEEPGDSVEEFDDEPFLDTLETTHAQDSNIHDLPSKVHVLPLYSMLSSAEQALVFDKVPEGHRLIVIATNVAETSITIPGVCYVVDTGRQKCRTYNAGTGVASYQVSWISKAAADQRAGRAGRTGPGHCYRLYSSIMYASHMEPFAKPEVLAKPLEDVVLSLKALRIENVKDFPFPTPPERGQIDAALKLLANLGFLEDCDFDSEHHEGSITHLGVAVSKLPVGVRYGKMILVSAHAGVLDYAIAMVAALSETSPFLLPSDRHSKICNDENNSDCYSEDDNERDVTGNTESMSSKEETKRWTHKAGDVMAALLAVGGYTFASHRVEPKLKADSCARFCNENGLNPVVMARVQKMRLHLARLVQLRLGNVDCVAAKTGGILHSMPPPNKLQEILLCQAIASGLLDNVAMLAPPGSIRGEHEPGLRSAYVSCSLPHNDPVFLDRNSVLYSKNWRLLPRWVCYDSLVGKTTKKGNTINVMKTVTPIEVEWLGKLAQGSRLLKIGKPVLTPPPSYNCQKDAVLCSVETKYGIHGWELPNVQVEMFPLFHRTRCTSIYMEDDPFRWFARLLLEGKVLPGLSGLTSFLNDDPSLITRKSPSGKVALLVSALSTAEIDNAASLRCYWAYKDNKFLFKQLKSWIKPERSDEAKKLWIETVKQNVLMAKNG